MKTSQILGLLGLVILMAPSPISKTAHYDVTLTREQSNLYKIDGTSLLIQTKWCMEFAMREEAILKVEPSYSFSKGSIIFIDSERSCEVDEFLQKTRAVNGTMAKTGYSYEEVDWLLVPVDLN